MVNTCIKRHRLLLGVAKNSGDLVDNLERLSSVLIAVEISKHTILLGATERFVACVSKKETNFSPSEAIRNWSLISWRVIDIRSNSPMYNFEEAKG